MKRIRINNDIRVNLSVSRNGLPENFLNLTEVDGLTLLFRNLNQSSVQIIPASYVIDGGNIDMVITADQVFHAGKYVFIIQYRQVNVLNPDGYDTVTWDCPAFEIVNSTSQVGGTDPVVTYSVDLYAEIGIGLKGSDGATAFELWLAEPENTDKTYDQYWEWIREPATTAAANLAAFDAQVINNVNAAISALGATNEVISEEELQRISDEQARNTAETIRIAAETARYTAEQARVTADETRVTAENARVNAETARVNADTARTNAETARASAESLRVAAETARVNAETSRAEKETLRVAAETARANAESLRVNAEQARVTAEQLRVTAEQSRVNADTARTNAETARASAESLRVAAETARVNAETVRENYVNGIRDEFNYYRGLNTVFSIDNDMNLTANIPDGATDDYSLNENGELIQTY